MAVTPKVLADQLRAARAVVDDLRGDPALAVVVDRLDAALAEPDSGLDEVVR